MYINISLWRKIGFKKPSPTKYRGKRGDNKLKNCNHFPGGGPKKKNFNNDDDHGHGQMKRRPSTYVEGKTL